MAYFITRSRRNFDKILKVIYNMSMKISEDIIKSKGIAYVQKYPYGELSRVTKNHKRHYETPDGRQLPSVTNVIIDNGLKDVSEVWGSEVSLYYEELYAGTTDLVGVYKGEPAIMDFKQSRRLKKKEWVDDYYLQLVAYSEAHNKQYGTNIKSGRMFICTQANEYQSFDIENYDYWTDQWYRKLEQYYKQVL